MQQFQDDIMKNKLLLEKINKELSARIRKLEEKVSLLESRMKDLSDRL